MYIGRSRLHVSVDPNPLYRFSPPGYTFRILLGVAQAHIHVRYLATFCIAAGTYASLGLVIAWCKYPTPVVMVLFRSPLSYLIPHIIQGEGNDTDQ